jgi:hypothetical protein
VPLPQDPPPPLTYYVYLDKFHIYHTRALHNDTDWVAMTAQAYPSGQPTSRDFSAGDVNDGDHSVGLVLGPYDLAQDASAALAFNYSVVNRGRTSAGDVFTTLNQTQVAALGAAIGVWAGGAGGAAVGAAAGYLAGLLAGIFWGGCDGVVAADSVGPFNGALLATMTASGPYSETRPYAGTDSLPGCRGNSSYTVTWHISHDKPAGGGTSGGGGGGGGIGGGDPIHPQ